MFICFANLDLFSFYFEILHLLVISRVWSDETPQVGLLGGKTTFSHADDRAGKRAAIHRGVRLANTHASFGFLRTNPLT